MVLEWAIQPFVYTLPHLLTFLSFEMCFKGLKQKNLYVRISEIKTNKQTKLSLSHFTQFAGTIESKFYDPSR